MSKLLDNARLSIELGVEDYQEGGERRVLSAIRNLYAGVLLLCKQVLWRKSPPGTDGSLIYEEPSPQKIEDTVQTEAKKPYRKTVNRQQTKARFDELGLELDWSKLQELAEIRNSAEHLYMTVKTPIAKEALASAMPVIVQLLEHLREQPVHFFSDGVWEALLENKDVFDKEQAMCSESFQKMDREFNVLDEVVSELRCSNCGSSLVRQTDPDNTRFGVMEIDCVECSEVLDCEDVFEAAIRKSTADAAYIAMNEGKDPPVTVCPGCHRESWIIGKGCILCRYTAMMCPKCGVEFNPDDFKDGRCPGCAWPED